MSIPAQKAVSLLVMTALLLITCTSALDAGSLAGKGVTPEWHFPEWHFPAWLGTGPHAPSFQVLDTTDKYGRYATQAKIITY